MSNLLGGLLTYVIKYIQITTDITISFASLTAATENHLMHLEKLLPPLSQNMN